MNLTLATQKVKLFHTFLSICEQRVCIVAFAGVIEVPVFSASDAYHILGVGRKNLHVASTSLNQTSSRSHSVFSVRMVKIKGHEASVTQ